MVEPLLRVTGLEVHFPIRSAFLRRRTGTVRAVEGDKCDVAFDLAGDRKVLASYLVAEADAS